jgi:hypothetical protein
MPNRMSWLSILFGVLGVVAWVGNAQRASADSGARKERRAGPTWR